MHTKLLQCWHYSCLVLAHGCIYLLYLFIVQVSCLISSLEWCLSDKMKRRDCYLPLFNLADTMWSPLRVEMFKQLRHAVASVVEITKTKHVITVRKFCTPWFCTVHTVNFIPLRMCVRVPRPQLRCIHFLNRKRESW